VKLIDKEVESLSKEDIVPLIETPPSYDMGDYAFPAFRLAKELKTAPNIIAEQLAKKFSESEYFENVENKGPYINFFINKGKLIETVLEETINKKENFGATNIGQDKTVIVEFSSPNIAK